MVLFLPSSARLTKSNMYFIWFSPQLLLLWTPTLRIHSSMCLTISLLWNTENRNYCFLIIQRDLIVLHVSWAVKALTQGRIAGTSRLGTVISGNWVWLESLLPERRISSLMQCAAWATIMEATTCSARDRQVTFSELKTNQRGSEWVWTGTRGKWHLLIF